MINLTDSAVSAIKGAMASSTRPIGGLRIMVEAGGCNGFKYKMGLAEVPTLGDTVIECGGLKVFVESKSHEHLVGTTIDFVMAPESSGFTFQNPNATASCSCGKSFS
ncbi:iron-sulfur cluster assembly protein [Bradyrhizobium sp. USDA 4518]|uniref:Iron-sulfur cluster assembly accessory protein n=1 Tax=Bradyrhizobium uaiense TaxID=2594946 RepID=A0A6P1BIB8_9BRAD|nr:iron-sulfur cluster assembly accessory protein [Bradyrhizobium uaiense]NEU97380.1 iron-sulfur cluster assembly accessory protein [Bradyrhizobium uaiense]